MKRTLLKSAKLGLFSVLALAVFSSVVFAQGNENARFALHAKNHFEPSKTINSLCNDPTDPAVANYSPNWDGTPCTQYSVVRATNEYPGPHIFLVVGQASNVGVAGASLGVNYLVGGSTGISETFTTFTECSDGLKFPNDGGNGEFPSPGGGLRLTWSTCQNQEIGGRGVHAVMGVFYVYVYSNDVLELTPNNNLTSGPELAITSCGGGTTEFLDFVDPSLLPAVLGRVQFGAGRDGLTGFTPCNDIVATQETTWGNIKNKYNTQK